MRTRRHRLAQEYCSPQDSQLSTQDTEKVRRLLEILEDRSYKTYSSRVKASERLAFRHRAWNTALISTSTASTIGSVAMLSDEDIYGPAGPTLLVCIAILTLVASLVTSSLDYSGRSRNMFLSYRRIQRLSAEVERAKNTPEEQSLDTVRTLNERYDALLDESENHPQADYLRAFPAEQPSGSLRRETALSLIPYVSLLFPLALLIPLVAWIW